MCSSIFFLFNLIPFYFPYHDLVFFCSVAGSVYVEAFDEIVSGPVAQYLSLSQKIGGDVQKHVRYSSNAKWY